MSEREYKYSVLHGAKENCGDFLIRDAATDFLIHHTTASRDDIYTVDVVRNELPEQQLDTIASTDAAFLAGGPGYRETFYPGIYPALRDILEVTALVPLGPGWKGTDETAYSFTAESLELLHDIAAQPALPYLGARDLPTVRILRRHGLPAELTGCPGWYRYGEFVPTPSFDVDGDLERILVSSPPRDSPRHLLQFILLVRRLAAAYPDTTIKLLFHRGQLEQPIGAVGRPWRVQTYRRNVASVLYAAIRRIARDEQIVTHDVSGSSAYAERYHDADLHVGYRVHAHIPSLSAGTPSFLMEIDGRGTGVSESLGTPGDVWASDRLRRPVATVIEQIAASHRAGYADFDAVKPNIREGYARMRALVAAAVGDNRDPTKV